MIASTLNVFGNKTREQIEQDTTPSIGTTVLKQMKHLSRYMVIVMACCIALPMIENVHDNMHAVVDVRDTIEELTSMPLGSPSTSKDGQSVSIFLVAESNAYKCVCKLAALIGICILTPIWEELFFRAFLMRAIVSIMKSLSLNMTRADNDGNDSKYENSVIGESNMPLALALLLSILLSSVVFAILHVDDCWSSFVTHILISILLGTSYAFAWMFTSDSFKFLPKVMIPIVIHGLWNVRCAALEIVTAS